MNKVSIKRKVLLGVAAATISLSMGTKAYASTTSTQDKSTKTKTITVLNKKHHGKLKENLDKLVKESKITQDQEDKILAYAKEKKTARKEEREKLKDMSKEQREAYLKEHHKTRGDFFKELVEKGIINQAQSDEIVKSLESNITTK